MGRPFGRHCLAGADPARLAPEQGMGMRKTDKAGQIGATLPGWVPRNLPPETPMTGRYCRTEPLLASHAQALFAANSTPNATDIAESLWTYLSYGPFADLAAYAAWLDGMAGKTDPQFHAILDENGKPGGVAAYLRVEPGHGVIEIGHICLSPRLQKTRASGEAMFLFMTRVFDELGYRRYEWKCDSLNAPSRSAARRLGFSFEGIFRQHMIYKGRNRDTAWYAMIDSDWPGIKRAFETWLAPENFDENGRARQRLSDLTAPFVRAG
jgi:RimJ/RimL family protein N-acetyltransferase